MQTLARRHPVATFLTFAYLAAAAIFATPLLSNAGIGLIDLDLPGAAPFILLSTISLAVAAFATTALVNGRPGLRDLRRRTFHFRVHPGWFVTALVLLPVTALATAVAMRGFDPVMAFVGRPDTAATILIGAVVAFLLVNWWEETAWTGFALERLQPRLGPIRASVVTTWMQAALHLPLVFIADGVTDGRV
ncbi:MAG TPA: CPBP family glutamic-type intramembrane protease, partial [Patescibacteria group bacterium]|nr:CPBP family glutamic-type intramembrane protease [Patescibacteria group bacterium]